jgi:hypothetical protein
MTKRQRTNGHTIIYKPKLKIEQHELQSKQYVNPGAPEGLAVPPPLVTEVVLLSNKFLSFTCSNNIQSPVELVMI